MKKSIIVLISALLLSGFSVCAMELKEDGKSSGNMELMLKAMSIIDDERNGFAPSNGSGYLIKLKYETSDVFTKNLRFGVGMYLNGDAGLIEWDEKSAPKYNKPAYGMVVDVDGESKAVMGELYVSYKSDYFKAKLGRQILNTPLTKIAVSLMPNFYEAYMLSSDIVDDFKLTAGHIQKISFGSRAMADWGLIGEKTGTAGVGLGGSGVLFEQAGGTLEQAKFYNIGVAAGKISTEGRSLIGIQYSGVDNMQANFWLYHSYDIADDYYAELIYNIPLSKSMKLKLSTQYLMQKDTGDSLAGEIDFNMFGVKVAFDAIKWGVYAAYNKSGDKDGTKGQYFNAWGADPAYTSTLFSRNAYRSDVDAYIVGAHYVIIKGLRLMINYANYGKSKTTVSNNSTSFASTDAYELDTILAYKPSKEWMLKIFNTRRLSEFDGYAFERRMNHYRVIASYSF